MAGEMETHPERPIDQLARHETGIVLLEEQAEAQMEVNQRDERRITALEIELRALRNEIENAKRFWKIGWHISRVAFKWAIYIGGAAGTWAWSHWDRVEAAFHNDKS